MHIMQVAQERTARLSQIDKKDQKQDAESFEDVSTSLTNSQECKLLKLIFSQRNIV